MKHLLKKLSVAGGKSKPKPKPAMLNPPALGDHQMMSSFSYAEIIDLISDGPIEGLVNKQGSTLANEAILQGVYLDDTAVAVTDRQTAVDDTTVIDEDAHTTSYDFSTVADVFADLQNQPIEASSDLFPDSAYKLVYTRVDDGTTRIGSDLLTEEPTTTNPTAYRLKDSDMDLMLNPHDPRYASFLNTRFLTVRQHYNDATVSSTTKEYMDYTLDRILGTSWRSDPNTAFTNFLRRENGTDDGRIKACYVINASDAPTTYNASSFVNEDGSLNSKKQFTLQSTKLNHMAGRIFSFVFPNLDANYQWDGTVVGFFLVVLDTKRLDRTIRLKLSYLTITLKRISWSINATDINYLANVTNQAIATANLNSNLTSAQGAKYNYNNILAEFRAGNERQDPFKYFNKVFIDKDYNRQLLGPFNVAGEVQRIVENSAMLTKNRTLTVAGIPETDSLFADKEGSQDQNREAEGRDYANWDVNALTFNEQAIPITHIIENPNVESVFVSLQINALNDTVTADIENANIRQENTTLTAGSKYPTVLNIRVEVGRLLSDGTEVADGSKDFQIISLAEQPAIIDIGNPDGAPFAANDYQYVTEVNRDDPIDGGVFTPFLLEPARPPVIIGDGEKTVVLPKTDEEETPIKRYVRVVKLSTETNSVLINKDVNLLKITEIIPVNMSYPFSSMIGVKVDSRTFSSIPTRTYDCKLKKVKIPTNYRPTYSDGSDRRYFDTTADYEATDLEERRIYLGDWDGGFIEGWTDNPAWVLYDLLTSTRYGLGSYIDEENINKWELYRIARFCDGVDDDGYFIGAPDGRGGVEPRYSCNILFGDGTKVFDAINVVASLFRGAVFYGGNEINFLDDRIKDPTAFFSNTNVQEGVFNYSNYRRDEQYNAIEVAYLDRFDNYKSKIEYVEDEQDISQRGLFKKQVNALGVTSKAMARRVGQHLIYQTIRENQSVTFTAGLETLLCKPGDLIIVEDDLKTLASNIGRVLDVDSTLGYIRIDEKFLPDSYSSGITIYTPTGELDSNDLENLIVGRSRLTGFAITGTIGDTVWDTNYISDYDFSGYATGYSGNPNDIYPQQIQYPVYTGDSDAVIWFSTGHTGWVWTTTTPFTDAGDYIATDTGTVQMLEFHHEGQVAPYDIGQTDRRGSPNSGISGTFRNDDGELGRINQGILPSELELNNTPQITELTISGSGDKDYGCEVWIDQSDPNFSMLTQLPLGSPYRMVRQNASDQTYKIISIKEQNPNEFTVIANKYDTGKYELIENDISSEPDVNTFGYSDSDTINDKQYIKLDDPTILIINSGKNIGSPPTFYLGIGWANVTNATGYQIYLRQPDGTTQTGIREPFQSITFNYLDQLGHYQLSINALGDPTSSATIRYFDSNFTTTGIDVFNSDWTSVDYDASYLDDFQL